MLDGPVPRRPTSDQGPRALGGRSASARGRANIFFFGSPRDVCCPRSILQHYCRRFPVNTGLCVPGMADATSTSVDAQAFYAEYHGHATGDLRLLLAGLRPRPVVWLAGDSSLDNKHWFFGTQLSSKKEQLVRQFANNDNTELLSTFMAPACNGLESLLDPPASVKDVAYWVNRQLADRRADEASDRCSWLDSAVCLNASIEESTVYLACSRVCRNFNCMRPGTKTLMRACARKCPHPQKVADGMARRQKGQQPARRHAPRAGQVRPRQHRDRGRVDSVGWRQ